MEENGFKRNENGTFTQGTAPGPGRPKGKTLKEYAREYFMLKSDDEKREYIEKLEERKPGFAWEMGEGKPKQDTDTHVDGTLNITWHEHNDTLQTENTDAGVSQL